MASKPEKPTLHHLDSSQSLRILWALEELNAAHGTEYDLVLYKRGPMVPKELFEVSSLGMSPVLTLPKPDAASEKDRIVKRESRLILNYLHDTYGRGMWDPAPEDVERDEFFQEFAQNTVNSRVGFVIAFDMVPQSIPWYLFPVKALFWLTYFPTGYFFKHTYLPRIFQLLEDAITDDKPWFAGAKMGKADILMSFPLDISQHRGYMDPKKYPRLAAWHKACQSKPAYQRALRKGGRYNLANFAGGPDYIQPPPE